MDIEKAIQFILDQHAKSEADFATWRAQFQQKLDAQRERADQQILEIRTLLSQVATHQAHASAILDAIAERHNEIAERHDSLARTVERLSETVRDHISRHS
jgi:chromosome segregation ATPase